MLQENTCDRNLGLSDRESKLSRIYDSMKKVLELLQSYLPLCNAHSNEFITHNHWENLLPVSIQEELNKMKDDELRNVMLHFLYEKPSDDDNASQSRQDCQQNSHAETLDDQESSTTSKESAWKFSSAYLNSAPTASDSQKKDLRNMAGFSPDWKHKDIKSFMKDAFSCHLQCLGILTSLTELCEKQNIIDSESGLAVHNFMTSKKSHEVDIMAEICSLVAKHNGIDVIVDMGSGKGYLSTQLALAHHLTVVGVDAMTTNTDGAIKRARILGKQWNGLVRNAENTKMGMPVVKRSKKFKKRQRREALKEMGVDVEKDQGEESAGISDDVLDNLQFVYIEEKGETRQDHFDSSFISEVEQIPTDEKSKRQFTASETLTEDGTTVESSGHKGETEQTEKFKKMKQKKNLKKFTGNYFPVTTYVDTSLDIYSFVTDALFNTDHSHPYQGTFTKESSLMLTGLHTCGSLGSSVLDLFLNNEQVKAICNVACCYHLMEEEYVCSPFSNEDEKPSFPRSSLLKNQKVGVGRLARNFASQSLYRISQEQELKSKAFPRCLLQKIILDTLGFVKDDWKGLRKLDQQTSSFYEYVLTAFRKLNLPTDKICPELIDKYCEEYKLYERKLAAFCQLKVVLAPCIEAIVLLDRVAFLLEQECVGDVYLTQLFDPVTSPRCYGIIAFKKKLTQSN